MPGISADPGSDAAASRRIAPPHPRRFPVVAVTGGIGCGKTMVAGHFGALGVPVIDADEIAHELTAPGGAAIPALRAAFGDTLIDASGALDRARMRDHVFALPQARRQLEGVLHPMIGERLRERIMAAGATGAPYALLVVPLLFEALNWRDVSTLTLAVDCNQATQIRRVSARSALPEAQVRAIMATQIARPLRLQLADRVLFNERDETAMAAQVGTLHADLLRCLEAGRAGA